MISVLFPAFSYTVGRDQGRTNVLFGRGVRYISLCVFPLVVLIVMFSSEILDLWLGGEFARQSRHVFQFLAIGVFFNSLAQVPFALIQAAGRPDLTAKLHLIELPIYLAAVWWLTSVYGIEGTAFAWIFRVALDALLLFALTPRFLRVNYSGTQCAALVTGVSLLVVFLVVLPNALLIRGLLFLTIMLAFVGVVWGLILTRQEKAFLLGRPTADRFEPLRAMREELGED
jgi:O-antigen/teichoic acid export membrane protein